MKVKTHDDLRADLELFWTLETGASPEAAAMIAERDMDSMHAADLCSVCDNEKRLAKLNYVHPLRPCGIWTGEGWDCEKGLREFPGDLPQRGCDACEHTEQERYAQLALEHQLERARIAEVREHIQQLRQLGKLDEADSCAFWEQERRHAW